jgi:hypothetical protein
MRGVTVVGTELGRVRCVLSTSLISVLLILAAVGCGGGSARGPREAGVITGNHCPLLATWRASPLRTSAPGGTIDVEVTATDADQRGDLAYQWGASAGSFMNPTSPSTVYSCTAAGPQIITVTVRDDHRPDPCQDAISVPVFCVAVRR